jgi:hypothetical protein
LAVGLQPNVRLPVPPGWRVHFFCFAKRNEPKKRRPRDCRNPAQKRPGQAPPNSRFASVESLRQSGGLRPGQTIFGRRHPGGMLSSVARVNSATRLTNKHESRHSTSTLPTHAAKSTNEESVISAYGFSRSSQSDSDRRSRTLNRGRRLRRRSSEALSRHQRRAKPPFVRRRPKVPWQGVKPPLVRAARR